MKILFEIKNGELNVEGIDEKNLLRLKSNSKIIIKEDDMFIYDEFVKLVANFIINRRNIFTDLTFYENRGANK